MIKKVSFLVTLALLVGLFSVSVAAADSAHYYFAVEIQGTNGIDERIATLPRENVEWVGQLDKYTIVARFRFTFDPDDPADDVILDYTWYQSTDGRDGYNYYEQLIVTTQYGSTQEEVQANNKEYGNHRQPLILKTLSF